MHIDHLRYGSDEDGCPGRIRASMTNADREALSEWQLAFDSFAIERPWKDNERYFSCVPAGMYTLVRHTWRAGSKRALQTWALVNETLGVYHYPNNRASRDLILLHPANTSAELQGCIAPVTHLTKNDGRLFGPSSGPTLTRLLELLDNNPTKHTYEIRWAGHGGPA